LLSNRYPVRDGLDGFIDIGCCIVVVVAVVVDVKSVFDLKQNSVFSDLLSPGFNFITPITEILVDSTILLILMFH